MNIHRLGTQKHNHIQQTLQLTPMTRGKFNHDGTLNRVEIDFYGYYNYFWVGGIASMYWCGPITSFLSKYPTGYWESFSRSHPWSLTV